MRILHIYKDFFPVLGGIENHIRWLATAQARAGHMVTVLVTSLDAHAHVETLDDVRVIFAARRFNLSSAPVSAGMFRQIRDLPADIVHIHSPYPFGEIAGTWFAHARARVLTYHSDIVRQRLMGAFYTPVLHQVLRRMDAIIATSPNYIESSPVLRHWREKCTVVPLGIPLPNSHTAGMMDANRVPHTNLLFAGKLRYYKGVGYLLRALTMLPEVTLTVVGTGPMGAEWQALARELGVAPRVRWAGDVPDAELAQSYRACDVFVLPCSERSEAFGSVQLEAMAAGKPVISCDVNTGVAWVNQNEVTGLVVPPKNPEALAGAIRRLLGDAAAREQMGAAGQARVRREFTIEKMAQGVEAVYARALQPKPIRPTAA